MIETVPILLIPGLGGSPRIYAPLLPALWQFGPVTIANHIRDDSMSVIASRILSEAPPRFALAGHSMGGYIALEIMRQAPERVTRLALLNTQARPDGAEARARRQQAIDGIRAGGFKAGVDALFPILVHISRVNDASLRDIVHGMADDIGPDAYIRQLMAIMSRIDSRPTLHSIACPTLVLTSDDDRTVSPAFSDEMAKAIRNATFVRVSNCGHLSQIEQPQQVTDAMVAWLQSPA